MHSLLSSLAALDLSSRKKRRYAMVLAEALLMRIRAEEDAYMARIPTNLQNSVAYDNADYSISVLDEAIELIASVYD